jgi:hypothetical protein
MGFNALIMTTYLLQMAKMGYEWETTSLDSRP